MSEFYVDLISNASMDEYPDNTLSQFTNRLCHPLKFDEEWEVAINEIFYPITFLHHHHFVQFKIIRSSGNIHTDDGKIFRLGYSEDEKLEAVIARLNDEISDGLRLRPSFTLSIMKPQFELDRVTKLVSFRCGNRIDSIPQPDGTKKTQCFHLYLKILNDNFIKALGYTPINFNKIVQETVEETDANNDNSCVGVPPMIKATHRSNLTISSNLMFIYLDIIEEHLVGDTLTKLMRIALLSKEQFSNIGHVNFARPYYFDLCKNRIETISVLLCNETGSPIKFDHGRVHLNLYFRVKKSI